MTAANYLSRMEMDPKEKFFLKIRDVKTTPIEVIVQSASVSEEEQLFFTEEDNETEKKKIWGRNKLSKTGLKVDETVIQTDANSEHNVDEITNSTHKLRKTNQILLEQSKDPNLLQY